MSATLHGTTSLIYLPGRTLTRLENGVVQVTRSYACRTSSAASFRGLFDAGRTMPGESGITVKFNFTETDRGDGFTEFQVTGSGPDPSQPSTGQSALKTQEGRAVQTYPSGLVRVERTYVCPTADEARFRPVLAEGAILPFDDGTPSIDGLYIFPTPNEIRRDDGYTELRVAAYGRVITLQELTIERGSIKGTYTLTESGFDNVGGTSIPTSQTSEVPSINETYTLRGVLPSSDPIGSVLGVPNISSPAVYPAGSSTPLLPGERYGQPYQSFDGLMYRPYTRVSVGLGLDAFSSISFGQWSEFTVTWRAVGSVGRGAEIA